MPKISKTYQKTTKAYFIFLIIRSTISIDFWYLTINYWNRSNIFHIYDQKLNIFWTRSFNLVHCDRIMNNSFFLHHEHFILALLSDKRKVKRQQGKELIMQARNVAIRRARLKWAILKFWGNFVCLLKV